MMFKQDKPSELTSCVYFHKKKFKSAHKKFVQEAHILRLSQPDLKFERGSEIDGIPFSANPAVDQSFRTLPTPAILFSVKIWLLGRIDV